MARPARRLGSRRDESGPAARGLRTVLPRAVTAKKGGATGKTRRSDSKVP
jgi:hypothetical protein